MERRILWIEKLLANAHRSVFNAAHEAEGLRDQGLADDLHLLALELARINEDLLRSRRPRKVPTT